MSRYFSDLMYDRYKRDPKIRKFYNSTAWKDLRNYVMQRDNYLCVHCAKEGIAEVAVDCHHIKKVKDAWEERLNQDNLEAVCRRHHKLLDKGSKHDDSPYYFDENGFPILKEEL